MTLSELIDHLTTIQSGLDDGHDPEVRLAHQPSWPFELHIAQVVEVDMHADEREEIREFLGVADPLEDGSAIDDARKRLTEIDANPGTVIYLGEGSQIGYLPGCAASELGWSR